MLVLSAVVFVAVFLTTAFARKRAAELRTRDWIVALLESRFKSNVELADFHVDVFPRVQVRGEGLSLRDRGAPNLPPLVQVEGFSFQLGLLGIFRAPHRIERIDLKRLVITIPPKAERSSMQLSVAETRKIPPVTVGRIVCENAELVMLSKKAGKDPLDWEIHRLTIGEVGAGRTFHFQGTLTKA